MPDRAASNISISIAPIYNRRISSAYALSVSDSILTFGERGLLHPIDKQQMQFTAISLSDADTSKYICDTQESALGGRGIIATSLLMLGTATASSIKTDFDSVIFNTMAQFLSLNDLDCSEDGIAVSEPGGLYFLMQVLANNPTFIMKYLYVTMGITSGGFGWSRWTVAELHLPQAKRRRSECVDYCCRKDCDSFLHFDYTLHKVGNGRALFSGLLSEI